MPDATLIGLLSQKGGSGKTTVAIQLAAGLARRGYRVMLADLDPQESASRWIGSAPATAPFPAGLLQLRGSGAEMRRQLAPVAARVDFIVMDSPPSMEHPHTHSALDLADLALIPVVPSPTDLWASRGMEQLVLQRMQAGQALRGALLPNRVTRTVLAGSVLEVMREFTLPVLDSPLSQRNAYAECAVLGASVYELGRSALAAQQEVDAMVSALLKRLED